MMRKASKIIELRIDPRSVRIYPEEPPTISDDITRIPGLSGGAKSLSDTSICLLRGSVDEFARYSRQEAAKWLIDIAHDICDPADRRGLLLVWNEEQDLASGRWCPVVPTDPLSASIYRYDLPDGVMVGLSKISRREGKSVAGSTGGNRPSTMDDRVKSRDECCWVTQTGRQVSSNSRILPKRMGDHVARTIFRTFTSVTPSPMLSIDDEIFGFCSALSLDHYFLQYLVGFRFVSENLYECHLFARVDEGETHTVFGPLPLESKYRFPALHGYIAEPPHPERDNVPPPGLFRWHYLQCVIKKFAHDDYRELQYIDHYEVPLRMEGDSEEEDQDAEGQAPPEWPSKALDLGRVADKTALAECEERRRAVVAWMSNV